MAWRICQWSPFNMDLKREQPLTAIVSKLIRIFITKWVVQHSSLTWVRPALSFSPLLCFSFRCFTAYFFVVKGGRGRGGCGQAAPKNASSTTQRGAGVVTVAVYKLASACSIRCPFREMPALRRCNKFTFPRRRTLPVRMVPFVLLLGVVKICSAPLLSYLHDCVRLRWGDCKGWGSRDSNRHAMVTFQICPRRMQLYRVHSAADIAKQNVS